MTFSGKRKNPYHLTLYIPPDKERLVKDFVKAYRARNESASQKIIMLIEDCMNNRDINPQKRLHQMLEPSLEDTFEKTPSVKCNFCRRKAEHEAVFIASGQKYSVCAHHQKELKENEKWKVQTE